MEIFWFFTYLRMWLFYSTFNFKVQFKTFILVCPEYVKIEFAASVGGLETDYW